MPFPIIVGQVVDFNGFKIEFSVDSDNRVGVKATRLSDGISGEPIRFKAAGNKLAADLPGVDSDAFVTNGDHVIPDGAITNG